MVQRAQIDGDVRRTGIDAGIGARICRDGRQMSHS